MKRIDQPNWGATPTICPACGARVSSAAQTCAVCGAATGNGGAEVETTMPFGTPAGGWRPEPQGVETATGAPPDASHTFWEAPSGALPPPPSEVACPSCAARLDVGARFCSECGTHVATEDPVAPPPAQGPEPPEVVVHGQEPLFDAPFLDEEEEDPGLEPTENVLVLPEHEETLREPDPALDPEVVVPAAPETEPASELDRAEEELLREARRFAEVGPIEDSPPAVAAPQLREVERDRDAGEAEPEEEETVVRRDPERAAPPSVPYAAPSWVPLVAAGFGLFALAVAMLVHVAAPSAVAGYSPAELDLKVQMRAVEWLLAGILVALVGALLRR